MLADERAVIMTGTVFSDIKALLGMIFSRCEAEQGEAV